MKQDSVHNNLCTLFTKYPELKDGSNDDVIDAYKEEFGRETASESIARAWRKLKEMGMYRSSEDVENAKRQSEKEYREYYGKGF